MIGVAVLLVLTPSVLTWLSAVSEQPRPQRIAAGRRSGPYAEVTVSPDHVQQLPASQVGQRRRDGSVCLLQDYHGPAQVTLVTGNCR